MKIFIINLSRSVERRESIEKQLNKLHLPYEFIEAIDGHALTLEEIRQHTRPLNYAFKLGEIGCSLSHLKVYREICERGIPKALILEDDAQLTDDLPLVLNELSNIIKADTPSITLLTYARQYAAKAKYKISPQYGLHILVDGEFAHGYVITASAAKKALDVLYPVWMVADKWKIFREYSIAKIYAVIPSVIDLSQFSKESTINNDLETSISDEYYQKILLPNLKKLEREEIDKNQPIYIKIKRFLWLLTKRPFNKIIKNDDSYL